MIKSLYVHIPFCAKKCLYCDFNSYSSLGLQDKYIEALIREIRELELKRVETIFIGGGTPTTLSIKNMEKLLNILAPLSSSEFTIEANPGTMDETKLKLMRQYGVNRLSIGLQAWQDHLLKGLGRIHNLRMFLDNYESARKYDFSNINIDLMFGIPGQTLRDWKETLNGVIGLKPEHISSYGLIVEEKTPFYDMRERGELLLPDEEEERDMYYSAVSLYKEHEYRRYEISNFSLQGFECRHNLTYWRDEEYIGVGAGAHSFVDKRRYSNKRGIGDYINGITNGGVKEEETCLSLKEEMSEFVFLGLRITSGIEKNRFKKRFNRDIYEVYQKEIVELIADGLLEDDGKNLKLTDRGIDLSNQVFIKFL